MRVAAGAMLAGALTSRPRAQAPGGDPIDLDWTDPARDRAVPARLYLPAAASATPGPLAVFSHGIGGTRRSFSWLGRHFAAHGIASLHLQHVGSDRQIWGGNPLTLVDRLQGAAQEHEALARVHDLRFALDTLLAGPWAPRVDRRRIVAAGHSYGANTTLLASGARVERQGQVVELHDRRIAAAIVLSAPPFYGEPAPRKVLAGVRVPSLHITSTEDVIRIPGYYSPARDRIEVFEATGGPRKWLAVFDGGPHNMLSDRILAAGDPHHLRAQAATQQLLLAFLRGVFEGDTAGLAEWHRQHAAILSRYADVAA